MIYKIIFLIFIALMPFGNFFFRRVSCWNGTGMYFQSGLSVLFALSILEKSNQIKIKNNSLAFFTLWLGILTCFGWYQFFAQIGQMPIRLFFPFFNFLCFIIFYKLSIEFLDIKNIKKIFKYFSYSIIVLLFYCALQKFNLDQFFKHYSVVNAPDQIVGTIGNVSHLAGYLALCQPFFFKKNALNILALALLWLFIILSYSASAVIVGMGIIGFYLFFKRYDFLLLVFLILAIIGGIFIFQNYESFFNFEGRWEVWQSVYETFKQKSITGHGLGTFGLLKIQFKSYWRHLHQEYYQLAIEAGFIGLGLALWCIYEYFKDFIKLKSRISYNDLTIRLASIFFGFCLLGLFNFCGHLWLMSFMGMMSYSFLYVIKNEELNEI